MTYRYMDTDKAADEREIRVFNAAEDMDSRFEVFNATTLEVVATGLEFWDAENIAHNQNYVSDGVIYDFDVVGEFA